MSDYGSGRLTRVLMMLHSMVLCWATQLCTAPPCAGLPAVSLPRFGGASRISCHGYQAKIMS
jgi:hypothetical protein